MTTMRSFAGRHSTLLVFSLCLGSSTAFVACGDDPSSTNYDFDAGETGGAANGGASTGGRGTGGAGTGGRGAGGTAAGGSGTGGQGGAPVIDSGPDVITSNGDASTD